MCDMASAQNGELAEVKTETGRMSEAVGVRDKKEQHMQGLVGHAKHFVVYL